MFSYDKKRKYLFLFIIIISIFIAVTVMRIIRNTASPADQGTSLISIIEAFALITSLIIAIFQLRDSKEISRASFITELNKSYVENTVTVSLYDKIQKCIDTNCGLYDGEENYFTDTTHECLADVKKNEISNYLTFFETLYILYCRGVIEFSIIDDLFAYRFFMAVHSRSFQKAKLEPQPENFKNIYRLEYEWLRYRYKSKSYNAKIKATDNNDVYSTRLLINLLNGDTYCSLVGIKKRKYCRFLNHFLGIEISPKSYVGGNKPSDYLISREVGSEVSCLNNESLQKRTRLHIDMEQFLFRQCTSENLDEIMSIQEEAFLDIPNDDILRHNSIEMFRECLCSPHVTLGAWYKDKLVAFFILYYPCTEEENLSLLLEGVEKDYVKTANCKLCIVRNEFRGNSLQYELSRKIELIAKADGVDLLCTTVSPNNPHSIKNVLRKGFTYNRTLPKYGGERNLYYKFI